MICNYGEKFVYIPPGTYDDQIDGLYEYVLSEGSLPNDSFLFYQTVRQEIDEIRYCLTSDEIDCKFKVIKIPDKDYEFLKNLFNYLEQNYKGPKPEKIKIPVISITSIVLTDSDKKRFEILDFNQ